LEKFCKKMVKNPKNMKTNYPQVRIDRETHDFLRKECVELDMPSITEFIKFLLTLYKENRELFHYLTKGLIGKPKQNLFDSRHPTEKQKSHYQLKTVVE